MQERTMHAVETAGHRTDIYEMADRVIEDLRGAYLADLNGAERPEPTPWPEWMTATDYQQLVSVLAWRAVEDTLPE